MPGVSGTIHSISGRTEASLVRLLYCFLDMHFAASLLGHRSASASARKRRLRGSHSYFHVAAVIADRSATCFPCHRRGDVAFVFSEQS